MSRISEQTREQVRKLAEGRCEYCRKPELVSTYGFYIDHIIPIADETDNLAWACFECNVNKGRDVASYDLQTNPLTPLYNPCLHEWHVHFVFQSALIMPLSPVGRVTVRILNVNHIQQLEIRTWLMEMGLL
jgi:hypothetical protein